MKVVPFEEIESLLLEKLDQNALVTLRVKGGSMFPFFKDNETLVTLEKVHSPLKRGDVILYSTDHGKVLHRIIQVKKGYYLTLGDALTSKEIVKETDVIAIVKSFSTKNKEISSRSKWYLTKVCLWNLLRPIRRLLLKVLRKIV